jgi:hypothetical protein
MKLLDFFVFNLPNPSSLHYGSGVDSASNRSEYQESSWRGKVRPAREADNLNAICRPIFKKYVSLDVSQSYGPTWPVIRITLLILLLLLLFSYYYYYSNNEQTQLTHSMGPSTTREATRC